MLLVARRIFRCLVGSARAEARRRGAARYPPAGADREGRRAGYRRIRSCRVQLLARRGANRPSPRAVKVSVSVRTVTQAAKTSGEESPDLKLPPVEIVELPRAAEPAVGPSFRGAGTCRSRERPAGWRSGRDPTSRDHSRPRTGRCCRRDRCRSGKRARCPRACGLRWRTRKRAQGRCRREVPITWRDPEGLLIEGVIDLAFEQADGGR